MKSYYKVSLPGGERIVPLKGIWKPKLPPRVAFLVWTAAMGRILTIDNLRKRRVLVLDWCCMQKEWGIY